MNTQRSLKTALSNATSVADLAQTCRDFVTIDRGGDSQDPLDNRARHLAFLLSEAIEGGAVGLDHLEKLAKHLADEALLDRMGRFTEAHRGDGGAIDKAVANFLAAFDGKKFDEFQRGVQATRAGIVFTAHPTFALTREVRDAFGSYFALAQSAGDKEARASTATFLAERRQRPDTPITLHEEHGEVLQRLAEARAVIRRVLRATLEHGRAVYPDQWRDVVPAPISLASWVGYDLDGRTDIHWAETFRIRLFEKSAQLKDYALSLSAICTGLPECAALAEKLARAADLAAEQARLFAGDLEDPDVVVAAANHLTADHPDRLVALDDVTAELGKLIASAPADAALELSLLRAEIKLYGLGTARIHLRVNAAQVRSTLHSDLGISHEKGFIDRTALSAAAEKAMSAKTRRVNFASIFREKMTARRQLMLCAQFLKHVDAQTPIRFLIAESEAPATIMGAVYLARLYGVDHLVDVSPLFETPAALESGGRFMERLLDEPEFVDYIKTRGRVAIQLGFSDSGRFMGQVAADLSIERLHILLAREMGRRNIRDVEVVLFNTHGDSMGRGGYPGSLKERFDHLMTPWTRSRYARENIPVNAESSFQGGDGFLHFQTPAIAEATVSEMLNWACEDRSQPKDDLFYTDINFSWDVYRAIKSWQEQLFENDAYQTTIGAFAPNFLFKTGSRKTRRQSGTSMNDAARSLRAIPHNAILQQLAAPANVNGGFGAAAYREPDRFDRLVANSPRMQVLYQLAAKARGLTSLSVLRSYASLYDQSFWTIRARHSGDRAKADRCNRIANVLSEHVIDARIESLCNLLSVDRRNFDSIDVDLEAQPEEFPVALYTLHAVRMAMMMRAMLLVSGVPSFSGRHEISHDDLIEQTVRMELESVAQALEVIFPVSTGDARPFSNLAEGEDAADGVEGYPEIHASIISPLREIDRLIKDISAGVAHFYGAFG